MLPVVQQDILNVLSEANKIIRQGNPSALRELSNHTIHNASIFQDEDSVSMAVVMYSLSKTLERSSLDKGQAEKLLISLEQQLRQGQFDSYRKSIKRMLALIARADTRLKLYIGEVIEQAEIKKGSKLYDHGISMAQAADLLGISQWELMEYVGKTRIIDDYPERTDIRRRLGLARQIFNA